MAWWIAAAYVASAVAKNDADQKATRAQGKALDQAAKDKIKAADSLIYANTINRSLAEARGRQVQSSQIAAYASSGVDISSGSVISTVSATDTQMLRNDYLSKFKAQADADLLIAQGDQYKQQAKAAKQNSQARQTQNLIGAGLSAYGAS